MTKFYHLNIHKNYSKAQWKERTDLRLKKNNSEAVKHTTYPHIHFLSTRSWFLKDSTFTGISINTVIKYQNQE